MDFQEFGWYYDRLMEKLTSIEALLEKATQPVSYKDMASGIVEGLIEAGYLVKKEPPEEP